MNIFRIYFLFLIGISGCNSASRNEPAHSARGIDIIRLRNLEDEPINLSEYKGKALFVNFWATWCKPCIEEMPTIAAAQDSLQDSGMIFLLASNESIDQIKEFRDNHPYKFKYVRIENIEELNIEALPATFVFNKSGDLVFSELGYRKWNQRNSIDTLLKISNAND